MYFYTVLRNLSSPEMITVVLTLPSAPEGEGLMVVGVILLK